jgi:photosystem II stability/assembly factor-like uncharacterized protein
LPAYLWGKQVDGSGVDSFDGLGVDTPGDTYIAASTYASTLAVKAAEQSQIASAGLYRIDGPGSSHAALGLTSASFVVTDPLNPSTLYAGSNGTLVGSLDGGATFAALALPSSQVQALVVNPLNDQILYAGTSDQGILKSIDGGLPGMPQPASLAHFHTESRWALRRWIDPTMTNILFAVVGANHGLWRSTDGGLTWQGYSAISFLSAISFDAAALGVLYGVNGSTVLKRTDHGATFTLISTPQFINLFPIPIIREDW